MYGMVFLVHTCIKIEKKPPGQSGQWSVANDEEQAFDPHGRSKAESITTRTAPSTCRHSIEIKYEIQKE